MLIIEGFFVLVVADLLHRENLEPIKLSLYSILATISGFISMYPNSIEEYFLPSGENSLKFSGLYGTLVVITALLPNMIFFYHVYRMNKQAPKEMKLYSRIYLAGIVILILGTNLIAISDIAQNIPGLHMLVGGIASFFMSITIAKDPKLVFILPFKAFRLMVIDTNSGIPIFTFDWVNKEQLSDEILYAGMIQGINLILTESVNQGEVQEIHLKSAVLLLDYIKNAPFTCVLVSTKSSNSLRESLHKFSEKFYKNYRDSLNDVHNINKFSSADKLVREIFPFLPYYN